MGTQSVKNNGWIKDLPSQVTNWNQAGYNPCPKNYFVPTRNEWYSLIQSIPENKRNLTEVFKLFRFGRTGNRNNNGGNTANSNMCQLWTGDKDEITQAGSVFIARDSDTDASVNNPDAIRMAVLGPGYTNYSEVGGPNNINAKSGGAPVRAFRKMHVAKELIEPQE